MINGRYRVIGTGASRYHGGITRSRYLKNYELKNIRDWLYLASDARTWSDEVLGTNRCNQSDIRIRICFAI